MIITLDSIFAEERWFSPQGLLSFAYDGTAEAHNASLDRLKAKMKKRDSDTFVLHRMKVSKLNERIAELEQQLNDKGVIA